jgi:hypothetical protein
MAKITIYKVAAAVYDIYCKSQQGKEEYSLHNIIRYHDLGNQLGDALRHFDLYEIKNGKIIWKGNPPNLEMIDKINNKRKEISEESFSKINQRINQKIESRPDEQKEELNQYKDALEKALLRINELETKHKTKEQEKKSFISKFFN